MRGRTGGSPVALLVSAVLLAALSACNSNDATTAARVARVRIADRTPRDVLLVTLDTMRHDAPGYTGSGLAATPTLDRLAASGVAFRTARAHAVVTLPSHASILTGLYPYQHGIRDNAGFVLGPDPATLAGVLRSAGYATAAFVSAFPLDRRFGLDRGFDVYDDHYEGHATASFTMAERRGDETVALAKSWWDGQRGRRRFLWLHLFTPHFPYDPPEPFAGRHRDQPYYGDVEWCDAQLRPLLDPLLDGREPPALVVVTSDHGESLGEHGEQTHGLFAYEATLRVPLVFWAPGLLAPGRADEPARHVDLLPSVLELLGLEAPEGLAGRSLFDDSPGDRDSYFEALSASLNRGWAPLRGRVLDRRKVVQLPIPELYDLESDPDEVDNLAARQPAEFEAMAAGIPAAAELPVGRGTVDPATVARLRALGYATSRQEPAAGDANDPSLDPKTLVGLETRLDAALASYRTGKIDAAVATLRDLIERQPRMQVAYSHLAFIYQAEGRLAEAIELLERARALGLEDPGLAARLALVLAESGRPGEAREVLRGHEDSPDPVVQSALGRIAAGLGEPEQARRRFERALELDPTFPEAEVDLGVLALSLGRMDEARTRLERALEADPRLAEGWNALGVVLLRAGSHAEAAQAWERAVEIDPRLSDALFNLALVLGEAGERERAIRAMERFVALTTGDERRRGEEWLSTLRGATQTGG